MCVMSMVHDHYQDKFPGLGNSWTWPAPAINQAGQFDLSAGIVELKKLIAEFREAVDAAKKIDLLTNQPDCVDQEKAKLQERVDRLEKIIDALMANKAVP